MTRTYQGGSGRTRFQGGRDLKSSQSYPRQFLNWNSSNFSFCFCCHFLEGSKMHDPFKFKVRCFKNGMPSCSDWVQALPLISLLRFGRALSRLRSQYSSDTKKRARKMLKLNSKQTHKGLDYKGSLKWIQWANLQPVLDCLMESWSCSPAVCFQIKESKACLHAQSHFNMGDLSWNKIEPLMCCGMHNLHDLCKSSLSFWNSFSIFPDLPLFAMPGSSWSGPFYQVQYHHRCLRETAGIGTVLVSGGSLLWERFSIDFCWCMWVK